MTYINSTYRINIKYSWGEEEEPVEVIAANKEEAFDYMIDLAMKELKACVKDYPAAEFVVLTCPDEYKVILHYGYDGEDCYYELSELI